MPCHRRKGKAALRQGFVDRLVDQGAAHRIGAFQPAQDIIASGLGGFRPPIRPARFRRLRQGDQQGLLTQRQAFRLMTEIAERSGAYAFEITAVGRQRQVDREDFALVVAQFQLQGAQGFKRLVAIVARVWRQQPRRLHGDGRTTRNDIAGVHVRQKRADDRGAVDAGVQVETFILDRQQVADKGRVGAVEIGPDTPAAIFDRQRPEPRAVAVQRHGGSFPGTCHIGRQHQVDSRHHDLKRQEPDQGFDEWLYQIVGLNLHRRTVPFFGWVCQEFPLPACGEGGRVRGYERVRARK